MRGRLGGRCRQKEKGAGGGGTTGGLTFDLSYDPPRPSCFLPTKDWVGPETTELRGRESSKSQGSVEKVIYKGVGGVGWE